MKVLAAAVLAAAALASLVGPTRACTAGIPTFEQVLGNADIIALGRVSKAVATRDHPHPDRFTIVVERTLQGQARDRLVVEQDAYLCGDGLGPNDIGLRILIATDVNFGHTELAPYWWQFPDGEMRGWAETPDGVRTLDELADRIDAALPDTSTEDSAIRPMVRPGLWLAIPAGLLAVLVFLARPLAGRRAD